MNCLFFCSYDRIPLFPLILNFWRNGDGDSDDGDENELFLLFLYHYSAGSSFINTPCTKYRNEPELPKQVLNVIILSDVVTSIFLEL